MTILPQDSNEDQMANFSKFAKKMSVTAKKLETARNTLHIKDFQAGIETLRQEFTQLENREEFIENLEASLRKLREQVTNLDYPRELESALKEQNLPFTGTFPNYEIPPFKLSVDINKLTARLSMGKKSRQAGSLSPTSLSQWIREDYKKLVNSKFNQERFSKELLQAYRYLTKSEWRLPVLIKDVYGVLTIKAEAKQEYSESRFMFDLSRLLDQYEIKYTERDGSKYIFDLSPHKEPVNNYTVVNESGREKAIGNLIIRKIEE